MKELEKIYEQFPKIKDYVEVLHGFERERIEIYLGAAYSVGVSAGLDKAREAVKETYENRNPKTA